MGIRGKFLFFLFLIISISGNGKAEGSGGSLPVLPNAQGFGIFTPAGRGGRVLRVVNLKDSGLGSLRSAVEANGPRTIIFEVSGRIDLKSKLIVEKPYVTIAGQTAPAPGIMLTGQTFAVKTHDVLVQHLSIRVGDEGKLADGSWDSSDSIQITGPNTYNVVFDHISASWSIDEIVGVGYGARDITLQNCLFGEGLQKSVHSKGAHGYGILLADRGARICLIGNLLAHVSARLPRIAGTSALLVNNIFYNKGGRDFSGIGSGDAGLPSFVSGVANLFLDGPNGRKGTAFVEIANQIVPGSQIYESENAYPGGTLYDGSHGSLTPPENTWIPGLMYLWAPAQIKFSVLRNAGARPLARDAVDSRIIDDVGRGTGRLIDSQEDVGGFPDLAQNRRFFDAGPNPNSDDNGNGYTNLEEILHRLAAEIEGR
ncbi:MAG: hypothetical protein WDA20_08190 [Desulfuromonadales bacterium]